MGWAENVLLGLEFTTELSRENQVDKRMDGIAAGARYASRSVGSLEVRLQRQDRELAEMRLATQARTRFLIEKKLVSADELRDFIEEVDAEDGVVDGQLRVEPTSGKLQFKPGGLPPNTPRTLS